MLIKIIKKGRKWYHTDYGQMAITNENKYMVAGESYAINATIDYTSGKKSIAYHGKETEEFKGEQIENALQSLKRLVEDATSLDGIKLQYKEIIEKLEMNGVHEYDDRVEAILKVLNENKEEEEKRCAERTATEQKAREDARERRNQQIIEWHNRNGIKLFDYGTERQNRCANRARALTVVHIFHRGEENSEILPDIQIENKNDQKTFIEFFNTVPMRWWLDRLCYDTDAVVDELSEKCRRFFERKDKENDEEVKEAVKEMTVEPEHKETNAVAKIAYDNGMITLSSPKDSIIMETVKSLGYKWKGGEYCRWCLAEDLTTGHAEDRMAELGNVLLTAGVPVCISDGEIRAAAVKGEFTPRCYRWIMYSKDSGKLRITWFDGRNDDLYQQGRHITGARWKDGGFLVPPEYYAEVLDYANINGFGITEKAQQIIAAEKQREIKVVAPAAHKGAIKKDELEEILKSPADILEDLKDD